MTSLLQLFTKFGVLNAIAFKFLLHYRFFEDSFQFQGKWCHSWDFVLVDHWSSQFSLSLADNERFVNENL